MAHYFPKLVDLHNYGGANSVQQKVYNWNTLNDKVLRKMQYRVAKDEIESVVMGKPMAIESVLYALQFKMANYRAKLRRQDSESNSRGDGRRSSGGGDASHLYADNGGRRSGQSALDGHPQRGMDSSLQSGASDPDVAEKDRTILELRETVEILELKVAKLEQLVRLKDSKIQKLQGELSGHGSHGMRR